MKVSVITPGCKVNQYESQAMETLLKERAMSLFLLEKKRTPI